MTANAIFLSNLAMELTEQELLRDLLGCSQTRPIFAPPHRRSNLSIQIYRKKTSSVAVVSGFAYRFDKLCLAFRSLRSQSLVAKNKGIQPTRGINVKLDTGERRQSDGEFFANHPTHLQNDLNKLAGIGGRKVMKIFSDYLYASIPQEIFNGDDYVGYLWCPNFEEISVENLKAAGYLPYKRAHYDQQDNKVGWLLKHTSLVEQLQAITCLNNNSQLCTSPNCTPVFKTNDGTISATCDFSSGIGHNPDDKYIIAVQAWVEEKGYIPMEEFWSRFLNQEILSRIKCICIKCTEKYEIKGVDMDLGYLAAQCKCWYNRFLDIKHPKRAIFWEDDSSTRKDDTFTRIVPVKPFKRGCRFEPGEDIPFDVLLEPIKRFYRNASHYRQILVPLLDQEKNYRETNFSTANTTDQGYIQEVCRIENKKIKKKTKDDKEGDEQEEEKEEEQEEIDVGIYSLVIQVPKTAVWDKNNPEVVSRVILQNPTKTNEKESSSSSSSSLVNGKVFQMISTPPVPPSSLSSNEDNPTPSTPSTTTMYIQAEIESEMAKDWIATGKQVKVIPIPNCAEHSAIMKSLQEWVKKEDTNGHNMMESLILGDTSSFGSKAFLHSQPQNLRHTWKNEKEKLFKSILNSQQEDALRKGETSNFSVIHGFPGSGKTHTIAVETLYLHEKENGRILLLAPSNYACAQLGRNVLSVITKLGLKKPRIIRILSSSKCPPEGAKTAEKNGIDILAYRLMANEDYLKPIVMQKAPLAAKLKPETIDRISRIAKENRADLLTSSELEVLKQHKQLMELEILKGYDIIISTVGLLGGSGLVNLPFSTIIIDEAGQLSQPVTLLISGFNPTRFIFAGDHLQLRPAVYSPVAVLGGLDISLMEAIAFQHFLCQSHERSFNIPWTPLSTQYRMEPHIYELVCRVVYASNFPAEIPYGFFKKLCNKRPSKESWVKNMAIKYNYKRVVVLNHNGEDQVEDHGVMNATEVQVIKNTVEDMIKNKGIPQQKISIITMYQVQKEAIIKALLELNYKEIEVENVDAIQGKENDVIILSLVRSNGDRDIGFLNRINRLNVALSRAKEFLVIPCNWWFYKNIQLQHWKKLVKVIEEKGIACIRNVRV